MKLTSLIMVATICVAPADDTPAKAKLEADYAEMRRLQPIASEVLKEHPTHQMWAKKKADLLAAKFIKTEELKIARKFADGKQARAFYFDTLKTFRGLEMQFRSNAGEYTLVVWASDADMKVLRALTAAE